MPIPRTARLLSTLLTLCLLCTQAHADAVVDWNARACEAVFAAKLSPLAANRAMAIVQTAVHRAVQAAGADGRASPEAAVAAANRVALSALTPNQRAEVERAYAAALAAIADASARDAGIALGEQAAQAMLAARAGDEALPPDDYRPATEPGRYVPTALPAGRTWPQRRPWLMQRADQFRPGPPPALDSALWARDYNEIKALGAKQGATRSEDQTRAAMFWEATEPAIYHQLVRAVAEAPGRDLARNARLYAMVAQATDDALIAVFDAKWHYGFWRPVTAIRNGDRDGNDATQRDPAWVPFIDTPMHPEYPCAHCIVAATVGTVLKAELGDGPAPPLQGTSSKAPGMVRRWASVDAFMQEVAEARICDGVHYRHSTEVGTAMGRKIGALAAERFDAAQAPAQPVAYRR